MPSYRRVHTAGGCYFFTVTLADRSARLLVDHAPALRRAFAATRIAFPFEIDAIVILPDHLHCVWSLPNGDSNYSTRWRMIKTRFSRAVPASGALSRSKIAKQERGLWQRRFWEHLIRDEDDYEAHVSYIHYNPVKHGHVKRVVDWPYSSFHRFVKQDLCSADWAAAPGANGRYGE